MKGKNNMDKPTRKEKAGVPTASPLKPLNIRQKEYISAIKAYPTVLCIGVLGSAKTYIPSVMAATMLLAKQVQHIVVARPSEGAGPSVGFFKGTKDEKLSGWCVPVTDTLKKQLGVIFYEYCIENGIIELLALEQCKGRSWDDTFVIIDEAEDLAPDVARSLVTRQGIRSHVVVCGDIEQQDIKSYSGLQYLLEVNDYKRHPCPVINFDKWEYCVRGEESMEWGMAVAEHKRLG
jgi:phosphate starvation-inducible PhoH-like protein